MEEKNLTAIHSTVLKYLLAILRVLEQKGRKSSTDRKRLPNFTRFLRDVTRISPLFLADATRAPLSFSAAATREEKRRWYTNTYNSNLPISLEEEWFWRTVCEPFLFHNCAEKPDHLPKSYIWDRGGFLWNFLRGIWWIWCQVVKMYVCGVENFHLKKSALQSQNRLE